MIFVVMFMMAPADIEPAWIMEDAVYLVEPDRSDDLDDDEATYGRASRDEQFKQMNEMHARLPHKCRFPWLLHGPPTSSGLNPSSLLTNLRDTYLERNAVPPPQPVCAAVV